MDDDVQPAPRERTGALRVRLPAGELCQRADGRRPDEGRSQDGDYSVTCQVKGQRAKAEGKGQKSRVRAKVEAQGKSRGSGQKSRVTKCRSEGLALSFDLNLCPST